MLPYCCLFFLSGFFSRSLSFSLLVAVSLKRCQIDGRVLRRLKYIQLPPVRERKNYFVPHQMKEFLLIFRSLRRKMCISPIWQINSRSKAAFQNHYWASCKQESFVSTTCNFSISLVLLLIRKKRKIHWRDESDA